MKVNARLVMNALAALSMGFLYGYFDYHIQAATGYQFMNQLFPWVIMFTMFVLPNVLIDYRHVPWGLANAALGLSAEDAAYWFWARTPPASWAWFYPVVWHVPLDDVAGAAIAAALYWWGARIHRAGSDRDIYDPVPQSIK